MNLPANEYAPLPVAFLRPGDQVRLDYEPIQYFGDAVPSHNFGVSRYLKTSSGTRIAYMGAPIMGSESKVLAVLVQGEGPRIPHEEIALYDPIVRNLWETLLPDNVIIVLQPTDSDQIHVIVREKARPVLVAGISGPQFDSLRALASSVSKSNISEMYSSPTLDDRARQVLSSLLIDVTDS